MLCLPSVRAACGNGVLDLRETCDDGNTVGGDGCSSRCLLELGFFEMNVHAQNLLCEGDAAQCTLVAGTDYALFRLGGACTREARAGCVSAEASGALPASGRALAPEGTFLLRLRRAGFMEAWAPLAVGAGGSARANVFLRPALRPGDAQLSLRWPEEGSWPDLDLVVVPVVEGAAAGGDAVWVGGARAEWAGGARRVSLRREAAAGKYGAAHGPEAVALSNLTAGARADFQVWVVSKSDAFSNATAAPAAPVAVDVFCAGCAGAPGAELAVTVAQGAPPQPPLPSAGGEVWWRVGTLRAAAGGLSWETCSAACLAAEPPSLGPARPLRLVASPASCAGVPEACALPATLLLYANAAGCSAAGAAADPAACGMLLTAGNASAAAPAVGVRAGSHVLVVEAAGFMRQVRVIEGAALDGVLEFAMVAALGAGEARLVLSWPVSTENPDLDIYVVPALAGRPTPGRLVYYEQLAFEEGDTRVVLERDDYNDLYREGWHGVEAVTLADLAGGRYEVTPPPPPPPTLVLIGHAASITPY